MNDRLAHVLWLGGSPCSGKSSVAEGISQRFGHGIYDCDAAWFRHGKSVSPESHPVLYRLAHAEAEELWLRRTVAQLVADTIASYHDLFPLILSDLGRLSGDHPVIAVGAALMPELVADAGVSMDRAVWMIPTEPFQRHHYGQRQWRHDVLRGTSDPTGAWENWMLRDAAFARDVARQARKIDGRLIVVDGPRGIDSIEREVARRFGLIAANTDWPESPSLL